LPTKRRLFRNKVPCKYLDEYMGAALPATAATPSIETIFN